MDTESLKFLKKTGADPKTIRKYLAQDDFSPQPPIIQEKPSKLDPFKPIIQEWLDEDKKHWRKQHHTAQRVYERLVEEHGYTGSYSIVQRYMKKCRSIQTKKANLELIWDPGPAQVDFGEADFYEAGKLCRKKYLTVSFPYSNDGYSQVFGGETAECVCQGLQDIFEFIGGVPPLLIFDNATGVGRRIGDAIHGIGTFSPVSVPIITSGCASVIPIPDGRKEMWSVRLIITVRTCLFQSRISMR